MDFLMWFGPFVLLRERDGGNTAGVFLAGYRRGQSLPPCQHQAVQVPHAPLRYVSFIFSKNRSAIDIFLSII